jgi:hypothetical protein
MGLSSRGKPVWTTNHPLIVLMGLNGLLGYQATGLDDLMRTEQVGPFDAGERLGWSDCRKQSWRATAEIFLLFLTLFKNYF